MESRPLCVECKTRPVEKHSVYKGKQYYRKTCEACRRQRPEYPIRLVLGLGKNPQKCERCGKEFPFYCEVHHRDKNRRNVNGDNLKVLCPNCHTLTHFEENQGGA